MLDTGMKSAMATDDKSAALRFAELSRPLVCSNDLDEVEILTEGDARSGRTNSLAWL